MTPEEINNEAELRYPVKTHDTPLQSPYAEMQKSFIHGLKYGLSYASQQSAALESENKELRKVLKELVELKDMKELIEADNFSHIGDYNFCKSEYETRKPLAWELARKLVKQ